MDEYEKEMIEVLRRHEKRMTDEAVRLDSRGAYGNIIQYSPGSSHRLVAEAISYAIQKIESMEGRNA